MLVGAGPVQKKNGRQVTLGAIETHTSALPARPANYRPPDTNRFFSSSRRRHTRYASDWSSDVCSSDLMFKTFVGPVEDTAHVAYLRPETAQSMFVNFRNVLETSRLKLPFGIGQIG